jgi:hypothetical protein
LVDAASAPTLIAAMKATFIVLLIDTATSATVNAAGAAGAGEGAGVGTDVGALGVLPPPHARATAVIAMTTKRFV